jgi:hypothetical protein
MKKAPNTQERGRNDSGIISQISDVNKQIIHREIILAAKIFFIVMAIMAALIAVLAWIARAI